MRYSGTVRRGRIAGRRSAPGIDTRRKRCGAVRRAGHHGRARNPRVGKERAGLHRGTGTRPHAQDPREHGAAEAEVPQRTLLYARAARYGHRPRL